MSTNGPEHPDPDDMFNDTRMSFGDHIEDLRTHLMRAVKGFVLGMIVAIWPLGPWVLGIIVSPVEDQLIAFQERKLKKGYADMKQKVKDANVKLPEIRVTFVVEDDHVIEEDPLLDGVTDGVEDILFKLGAVSALDAENRKLLKRQPKKRVIRGRITDPLAFSVEVQEITNRVQGKRLSTMNITEAFMVYLKVSMLTGLVITSPYVFYQIWMFVAAGLYPHEKRLVHIYLPFSLFLFITGVLVCQFLVMPRAIEAMLWFNEWLGLDADLRLNEWLGFALMMPLVFGVSFQTPLVMMFAHRIGVVTVQTFRDKRRMAWFGMAVFAAVITPSLDAMSMMFLWLPMGLLYELGILLCVYQGEEEDLAEWEKEEKANELVEV